jgi:hypothetical protein
LAYRSRPLAAYRRTSPPAFGERWHSPRGTQSGPRYRNRNLNHDNDQIRVRGGQVRVFLSFLPSGREMFDFESFQIIRAQAVRDLSEDDQQHENHPPEHSAMLDFWPGECAPIGYSAYLPRQPRHSSDIPEHTCAQARIRKSIATFPPTCGAMDVEARTVSLATRTQVAQLRAERLDQLAQLPLNDKAQTQRQRSSVCNDAYVSKQPLLFPAKEPYHCLDLRTRSLDARDVLGGAGGVLGGASLPSLVRSSSTPHVGVLARLRSSLPSFSSTGASPASRTTSTTIYNLPSCSPPFTPKASGKMLTGLAAGVSVLPPLKTAKTARVFTDALFADEAAGRLPKTSSC